MTYSGQRPPRTRPAYAYGQTQRTEMSSPSRDQNYDQNLWKLHRSSWRHVRHMVQLPLSGVLTRVSWPNLALLATSAGSLTYYNEIISSSVDGLPSLWCPPEPLTMPTLALGLLVTFRTNASVRTNQ